MEHGFCHSPQTSPQRKSKKCLAHISPEKLTFSGNFTQEHRLFDIKGTQKRASMRRDILSTVIKRTESKLLEGTDEVPSKLVDENPMYEDPRDVIVGEKPPKPPRKRIIQAVAVTSPRSRESRSLLKDQKRKLSKKYEGLITTLISRCEESVITISEKDAYILKLKDKLKSVLEYNKLFAEENDQLKNQHTTLVQYVEECKAALKGERDRNSQLNDKCKELGDRLKLVDVPDKDHVETAIPLVEVCMSCSSRQILLNQAREQTARLQRDMQALKDVLYRLNVQLSRYQEKLRSNIHDIAADKDKPERVDLDSLVATSLGYKGPDAVSTEDGHSKSGTEDPPQTTRVVDLSGLLSAQALAPLFDAYQENLQEKDTLILDYEKQFENINKKSKQIVSENKSLLEKVTALEDEVGRVRQSYKKLVVEKETSDIEKATLLERAEKAELKLKEVYELYEGKMSAMMRDYETVHREYFALKNALEASEGKMAALDVLRARTVPADLHERRLDHCKRLLEELKHQYSMENSRKSEQLDKLQQQLRAAEERCSNADRDLQTAREELTAALKNVRLYRKAAVIFRQRMRSATARATRVKRSAHAHNTEPLKRALDTLERIKREIKEVKSRAHTSLEELERRILEQERRATCAQLEYRRELERANLALEHKEDIIRSLIDKVADVEEVRLSQTNLHRLQGIVSDSSPERSGAGPELPGGPGPAGGGGRLAPEPPGPAAAAGGGARLVPGPRGHSQEDRGRNKGKG